jgi:hypothetical protein
MICFAAGRFQIQAWKPPPEDQKDAICWKPGADAQAIECGQQIRAETGEPNGRALPARRLQEMLEMFKADDIRIANAFSKPLPFVVVVCSADAMTGGSNAHATFASG